MANGPQGPRTDRSSSG